MKATIKGAFKSLTIWFNSVMATLLVALPGVQDAFPQLQGYLPEKWYHYIMGVLITGNILLRVRTTKPLSEK